MKVGFIISSFYNFDGLKGGAEIQLENTIKALKKEGIEASIINYKKEKYIDDYDLYHFFKIDQSYINFAKFLKINNKPFVVSTIFFQDKFIKLILYKFFSIFSKYVNNLFVITSKINFLRLANYAFPNTLAEAKTIKILAPRLKLKKIPNCPEDIFFNNNVKSEFFLKSILN